MIPPNAPFKICCIRMLFLRSQGPGLVQGREGRPARPYYVPVQFMMPTVSETAVVSNNDTNENPKYTNDNISASTNEALWMCNRAA